MGYFFTLFFVVFILSCIGDHIGNGDCASMTFEDLCKESTVITLTWGTLQGYATGDRNKVIITDSFPQCIAKASRYGFKPTTSKNNMVTLVKI